MSKKLKIFISHAWNNQKVDSKIRDLVKKLEHEGFDVTVDFDPQHNPGGSNLFDFMPREIKLAKKVLCVLSRSYKEKAEKREGGLANEVRYIQSKMYESGPDTVIPIILDEHLDLSDCTPDFIASTTKIILRKDYDSEETFMLAIIHAIESEPQEKGKIQPNIQEINTQVSNVMHVLPNPGHITVENLDSILESCVSSAKPLFQASFPPNRLISPEDVFSDLYDLIPEALYRNSVFAEFLIYVYHHIYGAFTIQNVHLNDTLNLVQQKIPLFDSKQGKVYSRLYQIQDVTGWINVFGGNCFQSFDYLFTAYQRWEWLHTIFENEEAYQKSLITYRWFMFLINFFALLTEESLIQKRAEYKESDCPNRPILTTPPPGPADDRRLTEYSKKSIAFFMRHRDFFVEHLKKLFLDIDFVCAENSFFNDEVSIYGGIYCDHEIFPGSFLQDLLQ